MDIVEELKKKLPHYQIMAQQYKLGLEVMIRLNNYNSFQHFYITEKDNKLYIDNIYTGTATKVRDIYDIISYMKKNMFTKSVRFFNFKENYKKFIRGDAYLYRYDGTNYIPVYGKVEIVNDSPASAAELLKIHKPDIMNVMKTEFKNISMKKPDYYFPQPEENKATIELKFDAMLKVLEL